MSPAHGRHSVARSGDALEPRIRSLRILIVDDIPDSAEALRLLLELEGHEARVALNGTDGLLIARALEPDVAIVHLRMPIMGGHQFAHQLLSGDHHPALHLIAVTSWDEVEARIGARKAGFHTFQVKPIDPPRFLKLINELTG